MHTIAPDATIVYSAAPDRAGGHRSFATADFGDWSGVLGHTAVAFPASSPWATAVGGAAAGIGVSFDKPSWQTAAAGGKRAVPDTSALADPYTGFLVGFTTAGTYAAVPLGGTSRATPILAALVAVAQARTGTDADGAVVLDEQERLSTRGQTLWLVVISGTGGGSAVAGRYTSNVVPVPGHGRGPQMRARLHPIGVRSFTCRAEATAG